jgi:hypothetical protein
MQASGDGGGQREELEAWRERALKVTAEGPADDGKPETGCDSGDERSCFAVGWERRGEAPSALCQHRVRMNAAACIRPSLHRESSTMRLLEETLLAWPGFSSLSLPHPKRCQPVQPTLESN